MLPVVISDEISSDPAADYHWITPEERAEALRNIPGRFGGSYQHTRSNAP